MKTAFSAFIYGNYEKYIPYYVYTINKTYPKVDIVLFYLEELSLDIKSFLKPFKNVIVYENFYTEKVDLIKHYKIKGGGNKTLLRFLIPGYFFEDYDSVYFGDVDILILKEKIDLFDFHKNQAVVSSLPFSNKVRTLFNSKKPSKRLTGLHFVLVKAYFNKIDPLIESFFKVKSYRDNIMKEITRDEELLYTLNKEAFDFDRERLIRNKRPWHGFHLGLVRGKDYLNTQTIVENSSISIDNLKEQLSELNRRGTIDRMLLKYECIEVYHTYKYLNLKLGSRVKLKYLFSGIVKILFNKLRKLKTKLENA
tara:strand:- start:439 stop:1365 length:927 start_codon:yes stop_codon:yes gene_type:complete